MKKEKNNINNKSEMVIISLEHFGLQNEDAVVDSSALALSIRTHRQNSRQGTVAVKSRSLLTSRSNKKPWKQKGTGRARAGSARSPLWRGGGVVFGPQERCACFSMPKRIQRKVSLGVLSSRILESQVLMLQQDVSGIVKSREAVNILANANLKGVCITVICGPHDENIVRAFANIPCVELVSYDALHPYMLVRGEKVVFFEKDKQALSEVISKWRV